MENIKVEHLVILAIVALAAFKAGKRQAARATVAGAAVTEANAITNQNQWWTYAGSWQS